LGFALIDPHALASLSGRQSAIFGQQLPSYFLYKYVFTKKHKLYESTGRKGFFGLNAFPFFTYISFHNPS
jgi:hypothetical protein